MSQDEHSQETRKHEPLDPDKTQVHRPAVRPADPPAEVTRRSPRTPPPIAAPQPPQPTLRRERGIQPRKSRRLITRLVRVILASLLAVLVVSAVFVGVYIVAPPPRTNILILGVDARPGQENNTRTDTIILATVDPDQPYVGMLSIPRDLWVNIPDYGYQRINSAHVFGESSAEGSGPQRVAATIRSNFDVPVHRYMRINFVGFVEIVDAAGGITIDVENAFTDNAYPTEDYGIMSIHFDAGEQHMDGEQALQYARSRHGTSDLVRSARQQQVIAALIKQMINPANWWRWPAVYAAFARNVQTNLTVVDAAALAPAVLWAGPANFDTRTFDRAMYYSRVTDSGAQVLEPIWDGINNVTEEMFR